MTPTTKPRTTQDKESSYQEFVAAAQQIKNEGRKPTLDAIRDKLGKYSRSTLVEHRARWLAEQEQASQANTTLSEALEQAVLAEIGRATLALKEQHQELINEYKNQVIEYQTWLEETQKEVGNLQQALQDKIVTAQIKELDLEKRLAAEQALVLQAERREQELRQDFKDQGQQYEVRVQEAIKLQHQAELEAARAHTRAEELTKQLAEIKTKK